MHFPRRCQLFVFAILIGFAAVLLPYAASASLTALAVTNWRHTHIDSAN